MKKKSFILKIDKPCGQDWSSMTKTEMGNFCAHCSKTVIDFSQRTDTEIIRIIEQNQGKLCGRLTREQLNRPIQAYHQTNYSRFYKILTGLLLFGASKNLFATNTHKAQQNIISTVDDNTSVPLTPITSQPKDSLKNRVQGTVIDIETKEPVDFATIRIKGTEIETTIDFRGRFELVIPDSLMAEQIYLTIIPISGEDTEFIVKKDELPVVGRNFEITVAPIEIEVKRESFTTIGELVSIPVKKRQGRKRFTKKSCQ
ncbi:MAG TPA: hypothetical protein PLP27_09250 [Crocinitomicaceae bacterium]|nr:hypothetical protein [Crocinitomicaceae bacterium]